MPPITRTTRRMRLENGRAADERAPAERRPPIDEQPPILTLRRSSARKDLRPESRTAAAAPRRSFLRGAAALAAARLAPFPVLGLSAGRSAAQPASGSRATGGSRSDGGSDRLILVLGDSLAAEYGIGRGEGWVKLLEQRAAPRGWGIVNASISGETTSGGLSRLPALLAKHQPDITVIELGSNDALRGLQMAATEANLRKMVQLAREAASQTLLVGMMMPPNFGPAYARQFSDMFRRVAEAEKSALVPFLLEGFADDLSWFQPDRIHPTAKAQPRMLDNVWPVLSRML